MSTFPIQRCLNRWLALTRICTSPASQHTCTHSSEKRVSRGVPGTTTMNTVTGTFFHHSSTINTGSAKRCYVYIAVPEAKTGARYQSKLVDTAGARVSLATGIHFRIPFHVMLCCSLDQWHQGMLKGQLCFLFVLIAILLLKSTSMLKTGADFPQS